MVGDFQIGGRETEFAPAPVAVDDFARVGEISAKELICRCQIARRYQSPNPRATYAFPVNRVRLANFRLEAVAVALAQEHTTGAAPESSERVILPRDDISRRNFIAEQFQKFFGRFFT